MALFKKNTPTKDREYNLPEHIGIIMDGNGRWAKKRMLPRSAGHRAGAKVFRKIVLYSKKIGIKYLTVYAFSTENWKRPDEEVGALMKLFKEYLEESLRDFADDNVVVRFLGDKSQFSPDLQALLYENEDISKNRDGMVLNIALNYGSRDEIVMAIKKIAQSVKDGEIEVDDITEQTVSDNLYTAHQPDPDLIIRPSGEYRISNFLLWQSAYTEFVIMDKLWPDFTPDDLDAAIETFNKRNRRFGGV